jgi:hypothetical protein
MRDEGETFWIPRVEPEILRRQIYAALMADNNHDRNLGAKRKKKTMRPVALLLTSPKSTGFITRMKLILAALGLMIAASGLFGATEEPRVLAKVTPLPVALSKDFEFRKTKLFFLSEKAPKPGERAQQSASKLSPGGSSTAPSQKTATLADTQIVFERQYRLFGAVTGLDQAQRCGDYFDFFWRAKRPADVTVRLEYRQEKLHDFVQAQEISYQSVRGTHKTEFKVIGDDYFDDGRVIAWRCLLIENSRIVAENRSYMWK